LSLQSVQIHIEPLVASKERAHLGTTTKAGSHANRNAGFIRQAGEWHWGCRMNPAFRWCQVAPLRNSSYPFLVQLSLLKSMIAPLLITGATNAQLPICRQVTIMKAVPVA
jgi:hypothetical protein